MVTYYVNKNDNYKVIATVSCEVLDGNNNLIGTCSSGETLTFKAPTSKISISDDNAVLTRNIESSVGTGDVDKHVCDPSIHCTPEEKENWNAAVDSISTTLTELENKVDEHINDTDVHVTPTDRYNWDKKLDYSALYDVNKIIAINGAGTGNINTYGFTYKAPRSGYVTAITCCCDTSQTASTQAETGKILIKLWRADSSFLAVSGVSLEHQTGGVLHYWFKDAVFVKEGELLRVTFHAEGDDSTTYAESMVECYMETVAVTSSDQGGLLGSDGTVSNSTCVVKHTWYIDAVKYADWEHTVEAGYHGMVGEVKNYAGRSIPNGWLLCDGSAVSRSGYPRLFAAIGTTWGEGDGSSTFNLPNLIDRVAWGSTTSGEYLDAGLPNITGSLVITDENSEAAYLVVNTATGAFDKEKLSDKLNLGFFEYGHPQSDRYTKTTFDASRSSDIYGKSVTVQPPAAKLIPIIKY